MSWWTWLPGCEVVAWAEIGFPGPAYPRGYKNIGVDKLEPFEVRDARPAADPVRKGD